MGHPSEPSFLALHTVRLRSFAGADAVAAATGLPVDEASALLDEAVAAGLAELREGRLAGYHVTVAGRRRDDELIAAELATGVDRGALEGVYRRFLALNPELLEVCTAWQLRPARVATGAPLVRNDHADGGYDAGVRARLATLDDDVQPVCTDLAARLERFGTYGRRLAEARRRVEAGEVDWLAKPLIDSYHTVWFELHEDLLTTLGIERSKENNP